MTDWIGEKLHHLAQRSLMSKKVVVVEMEDVFEGDYYTSSELPDVVDEWISAGFED